jgi:elongation factor P
MECIILWHADEDRPVSCEIPGTVVLEVTYTEPGMKGNTATNTLKPATVETGAEIRVPLFIENGEKIVVNTADGTYKERAK